MVAGLDFHCQQVKAKLAALIENLSNLETYKSMSSIITVDPQVRLNIFVLSTELFHLYHTLCIDNDTNDDDINTDNDDDDVNDDDDGDNDDDDDDDDHHHHHHHHYHVCNLKFIES